MYVDFIDLKFKNFLSFGNGLTTVTFEPGLNLITGKNGCGKSGGLLDPLSYALFGKPYRKIKNRSLVNRTNKKGLYVEVTFKVGNDVYNIIRQQYPDTVDVLKNGNKLELLSSMRIIQDEINLILGINYTMFRQVISLAINYNKPYLAMTSMEKRDIIESVFNIKVFGEMLRNLKMNMTGSKTKIQINKRELKILEESLFAASARIDELRSAKENFQENKDSDLLRIATKIEKYEDEREDIRNQIANIEEHSLEDIESLKLKRKELQKEYQLNRDKEHEMIFQIKANTERILFLKNNSVCHSCKREFAKEYREDEIRKFNEENKKIQITKDEFTKLTKDKKTEVSYVDTNIENQNNLNHQIATLKDKEIWFTTEIIEQEERREDVSNRSFDTDVNKLEEEHLKKISHYHELFKETEDEEVEYKNCETAAAILSDSGIKAYFFRKLMPILNAKINEYLKKFEIPIKLELDEYLEDKIYGIERIGEELEYMSHSEGEKKRIDISILFAFIDVTKIICNWDCSLLIMDELLDGQVDEDGLEVMLSSLTGMVKKNKEICIYIISHRLQDVEEFDKHFKVSKASGFSKIERIY